MVGGTEWGEMDHLLILAYQRYLDLTCTECGGFVLECRNAEHKGVYEVDQTITCYRKQALDDVTKAKDYKPENGQVLSVRPIDDSLIKESGLTYDPDPQNGSP